MRPETGSAGAEAVDRGPRRPFHGLFAPGICFESGHSVWLYQFESTPTPLGDHAEVRVVDPGGGPTLFVDRAPAAEYAERHHAFDRAVPATTWRWPDDRHLELHVRGVEGSRLDCSLALADTPSARLASLAARLTPDAVARTRLGRTLSAATLDSLVGLGRVRAAGLTERGVPYREVPERVALVEAARAVVDGCDCGRVVTPDPDDPVAFGDARAPARPAVFFGDLLLASPVDPVE